MVLDTGVVVDGRYRLEERLATGGMGDVWRGTDTTLGRAVAVKVLLPALLADPSFGVRFQGEARMLATLHHPGVVRVFDYGECTVPEHGEVVYLVMEFVDGEPLSQRLADGDPLDAAQTMSIVAQAADALHAAHSAGIVHRDVKPGNLLLRPDHSVTLVDFGVAHLSAATRITSTNAVIGTALYMAPEQASGGLLSAATDIYALGAVAYHCLTGEPPFTGKNPLEIAVRQINDEPAELPAEVPAPVRELVGRALAKDPAARYPDAAAFAAAARAAAAGRAAALASTAAATAVVDVPRGRPSKRVVAAVAAGALVVLGGLATLLALTADHDNAPPVGSVVSSSPASQPAATQPAGPGAGQVTSPRRTPGVTATSGLPASPTPGSPAPSGGSDQTGGPVTPPVPPTTTAAATPTQPDSSGQPDAPASAAAR